MGGQRAWRLFGRVLRRGHCAWRLVGRVLRRGSLSVAACWAGAAHPRRQKHREMPPPGASAPAFAATAEPASCPPSCKHPSKTRTWVRDGTRAGGCAEDGLLRASILDFRGRLANRCKVLSRNSPKAASILDFMPRLANRCSFLPGNALHRAVILDLRGSIWESLQVFAWKRPPPCSDS